MNHVHLISNTNSLMLRGLIYPHKNEVDLGTAAGTSQAGDIYISKKSASSLVLVRPFAGVSDSEYEALTDWYLNESEGPRRAFTFIDGNGLSYTVRWLNSPADWQKDSLNRWSGILRLRVENAF